MREVGKATRNPVMVATANQIRSGLRGPLGAVLNIGRQREEERDPPPPLPSLRAPRTPFNGKITAHRKFAFRSSELSRVKEIKNAVGATVNDVVMAVCAGALRTYLDGHGVLPAEPLVAMVPVSIRTGEEEERWTNRVSGLLATLPTDEPDPLLRIQKVHESMSSAKDMFSALPAESLTEFSEFPPPAVFARTMRMATRLSTRGAPPVNLVISNVPGPRQPLYSAGARLRHYYPVSTIVDGQGLNITVQSYLDTLDFGLVSCRELVPDVWDLADLLIAQIDELAKAAGVG
jgi:WS/DGAT/MGAT family acyltransferase